MSMCFASRVVLFLFLTNETCKSLPKGPRFCSKYKNDNFLVNFEWGSQFSYLWVNTLPRILKSVHRKKDEAAGIKKKIFAHLLPGILE